MKTIIEINAREALPVRAIPYVTCWTISPDNLVQQLALTGIVELKLDSYLLNEEGRYSKILTKEWDGFNASFKALSERIKVSQKSNDQGYETWRIESISVIPPATFVWKDEFEKAFNSAYSTWKLAIHNERQDERRLNFSPMIPKSIENIVMEGFHIVMSTRKPEWKKWNLIDDAEVWKVIALSFDIEPNDIDHNDLGFKDRLEIIQANHSKIDPNPKLLSLSGFAYCHLNVPKFARWAIENGMDIPDELKQRAEALESSSLSDFDAKKYREMSLWSEAELQAILCGLSPDGARPANAELNNASEQIKRAVLAKELAFISPTDATAGDKLYAHDRFFKPNDAIAWAGDRFSKFPFKGEQVAKVDKPLSARAENNYLRLIFALANGIKDFNPKKHFESAKLIIDETGVTISQDTIASYIQKAYELDSKERG